MSLLLQNKTIAFVLKKLYVIASKYRVLKKYENDRDSTVIITKSSEIF